MAIYKTIVNGGIIRRGVINNSDNREEGEFPAHIDMVGASAALTNVQRVNEVGNVLNLMPKGKGVALSNHPTLIVVPDYEGNDVTFPANAPVWRGARTEGTESFYDSLNSAYLACSGLDPDLITPRSVNYVFSLENFNTGSMRIDFTAYWEGDDTAVVLIGAHTLLTITASQYILSDGVNSVTLPAVFGRHKVSIYMDTIDKILRLTIDAQSVESTYALIAQGNLILADDFIDLGVAIANLGAVEWVTHEGEIVTHDGDNVYLLKE